MRYIGFGAFGLLDLRVQALGGAGIRGFVLESNAFVRSRVHC